MLELVLLSTVNDGEVNVAGVLIYNVGLPWSIFPPEES